jgi:hypothetical protein
MTIGEARALGLDDLLIEHHDEAAALRMFFPLDVDWPAYLRMERAGQIKSWAARRGGKLVGYTLFYVHPQMHAAGSVWAVNDLVYLVPEERRGWGGVHLIRGPEQPLRDLGARCIWYNVPIEPPLHRRDLENSRSKATIADLLRRLGYLPVETSLVKVL